MKVYTAPDQNWPKLKLYQKNCSAAIDDNEGGLVDLIISSSTLDTGHDVKGYDMKKIIVKINSTILTDNAVWTDDLTDATGYAKISLHHP